MAIRWSLHLYFLLLEMISMHTVQVQSQTSALGFISIDCGIPSNSSYVDSLTGISYTSDDQFIDEGSNQAISPSYTNSKMQRQLLNVRSFPSGSRNCYTFSPLKYGGKYLIRATFMYGNYDGQQSASKGRTLLFDLHIDVNFWKTVNLTDANMVNRIEAIAVSLGERISVCLINNGSGTPFISALELRPLKDSIYSNVDASQYFVLSNRLNVGPETDSYLRYPDDPFDRIWQSWSNPPYWTEISTLQTVKHLDTSEVEAPSAVMQTAASPVNSTSMFFHWDFSDTGVPNNEFYVNFIFAELVFNVTRNFSIYFNDEIWEANYSPIYLTSQSYYSTRPLSPSTPNTRYQWALNSTGLSQYPPLLNALEIFSPMHLTEMLTYSGDVDAISNIKKQYQVNKNWKGDPCGPGKYIWDGLKCSKASNFSRIISVDLSSSGLNGTLSSYFSNLTQILSLDLFNNSLTGGIPENLGDLLSLKILNLSCNNLTGKIPDLLYKRSQNGLLKIGYDNESHPCILMATPVTIKHNKNILPIAIGAAFGGGILLLLVVVFIWWIIRKLPAPGPNVSVGQLSEGFSIYKQNQVDPEEQHKIRQFTYSQLAQMTKNFVKVLGKGGFGTVFLGHLDSGKPVAVKLHNEASQQGSSQASVQGTKELLAEIQNLKRIYHRNLVSLIGYCIEGTYQALVYEYMPRGSLVEHLRGIAGDPRLMCWSARLRIAADAAQGLEYLHKGCNPPIIHRDIKTSNILLNNELEAKISDFGLSRAFKSDQDTHVTTGSVAGTPGYLDPEFSYTMQLTAKSDIYSFGIVLLELITGQPAIISGAQKIHILQWVAPIVARGDIGDLIDRRLHETYDVNSAWKVVDLAMKCTAQKSTVRPSMTHVLEQLNKSLEMVNATETTGTQYSEGFDRSEVSAFEIGVGSQEYYGPLAR